MSVPAIDFFLNSTMLLRATVKDVDEVLIDGATVTVTIVHALGKLKNMALDNGSMVSPIVWPVTLAGVGKGRYEFIFPSDLPITREGLYKAQTNVSLGANQRYAEPYIKVIVDRD